MSTNSIPVFAGILQTATDNKANAIVVRESDGSVNCGSLNATELNSSGTLSLQVSSVSTAYTAGNETVILANASSAAFTVTLPPSAASTNQVIVIVKTDSASHTVTIQGNGTELIGSANTDTTSCASQYGVARLVCNGSQWYHI